ncbi:MAG: hypothetical protein ISS16_05300 [Ignavibacteria bacterium]|nr:hypothetical protein [Ignavibacteria bacterium]
MNLKKSGVLLILMLTALNFNSCYTFSQILPEKRPDDVVFFYSESGGMLPVGKNYLISADSSFANYYIYDARNKTYFNVSLEELDKLYKVFYKNDFGKIKTFEEMVYDRGGNTVSISWKGERISKSNSGISFIEKEWKEEYSAIVSAIRELVDSKINKLKINFTLKIDTSIVNLDKITKITIDDDFTYYSARDGVKDSINLNLLPGEHNVQAYLMTSGESELQSKVFASKHFVLDITQETNVINLYVEEKEIKWR